jgi:ATP-binding cassette subfamily E protein 1
MVKSRVEAIKFESLEKPPIIVESLCSGCGICVKKCSFRAIAITNIPEELEKECVHRYGPNTFKLFRLPIPRKGFVTGLIGRNGIGKTTALRILSGNIVPNLGNWKSPPSWTTVIKHFRGSPLQNYFKDMSETKFHIVSKPQNLTDFFTDMSLEVSQFLAESEETPYLNKVLDDLKINELQDKKLDILSGGELQKVAIGVTICKNADVYIFDEPSSHLDVYQRIQVAKSIQTLVNNDKIVVVSEHDLAMLDYLSHYICLLYGEQGIYGIVSNVHSARNGINIYLRGYIPDENVRFRREEIKFNNLSFKDRKKIDESTIRWPPIKYSYNGFSLEVDKGDIRSGEIVVALGPNGIGKTTFIKIIAGIIPKTSGMQYPLQGLKIAYKPQHIYSKYQGTTKELLNQVNMAPDLQDVVKERIFKPLDLTYLLDKNIDQLSGGELQRVAIAACIIRDADVYLLDEPSAYIDIEERLIIAKIIREIVEERKKFAFIAEHDLTTIHFLSDAVMMFQGLPGVKGVASSLTSIEKGMNNFLKKMDVTFRRDPESGRLRANKPGSKMDRSQRETGEFYSNIPTYN